MEIIRLISVQELLVLLYLMVLKERLFASLQTMSTGDVSGDSDNVFNLIQEHQVIFLSLVVC